MGDLIPAIEQHEVLYQIMKKHSFLPEAITSDFQAELNKGPTPPPLGDMVSKHFRDSIKGRIRRKM